MTPPEHATAATIARPVLAGHRAIAGVWLPDAWYDEATRRRLVLQLWRAGSTLARWPDGELLQFAAPLDADCEALPGWPLQRVAGTLCSADIAPAQLSGRAHADVLLALGADWRALSLADAKPVDPSAWLDVAIGFVDMADCRLPPAERVLVEPPARELREVLGDAVPAQQSDDARGLLAALARHRERTANAAPARAKGTHGASGSGGGGTHTGFRSDMRPGSRVVIAIVVVCLVLLGVSLLSGSPDDGTGGGHFNPGVLAALGVLLFLFLRQNGSRAGTPGGGAARPGAPASAPARASADASPGAAREGLRARARRAMRALPARATARVMPQRWREWAARLAMTTGIANLLGAQHSAYLQRMLKMFDEGELDDALRHAIPLGNGEQSLGQQLGRLTPRSGLGLRATRGPATAIGLGDDLERHLRTLYRRTFEQLDRQGRIDEAVFVLAELLNARQEALDYLEKHGRHAQAAELALGWDMPAAQIVRLHALAGNWQLAVLVARRDNAFDAAVTLLEKKWPDAANQLRREWGASLAASGRWLAAVHVVWRLESERAKAAEWLQVAEAGGGTLAARALALRAQCLPQTLATRVDAIAALRDDPHLAAERVALALELLQLPTPVDAMARRLAAAIAGPLFADQPALLGLSAAQMRQLVQLASDAALSADMPTSTWPGAQLVPLAKETALVTWEAPEAGALAIVDAVALPDGEFLVALGEAGAVRVDARGRRIATFAVPAHQLVIADDGGSALALAKRERTWRVSRLDLARGQSQDLGQHEFGAFARSFDGIGWSVGIGNRVQVLDTTRGLAEALWQVGDLPGTVVGIDAGNDTEIWLLQRPDGLEQWKYALPGRRLAERELLPPQPSEAEHRVLAHGVGIVEFSPPMAGESTARVIPVGGPAKPWKNVPWYGWQAIVAMAGDWLVLAKLVTEGDAQLAIELVSISTGRIHGRWVWPRESRVQLRSQDSLWMWIAYDDQGRLASLDTATGEMRCLSVR